jgi:hypothetical protein
VTKPVSIEHGPHALKSPTAGLVYRAALEILEVNIAPHPSFAMKAFSGGGRGAKPKSARDAKRYLYNQAATIASHFSSTREITVHGKYVQRGGTLPEGHYTCRYIAHKPGFGECIKLDMWSDAIANSPHFGKKHRHHRDGFLIHGRGPKGSDGCIVPEDESKRLLLNRYVKERGTVVLLVKDVGYQMPAEMDFGRALA